MKPICASVEPGSGSYLLQLLIASFVGALLALRIYWGRVQTFVKRLFGREVHEGEE